MVITAMLVLKTSVAHLSSLGYPKWNPPVWPRAAVVTPT